MSDQDQTAGDDRDLIAELRERAETAERRVATITEERGRLHLALEGKDLELKRIEGELAIARAELDGIGKDERVEAVEVRQRGRQAHVDLIDRLARGAGAAQPGEPAHVLRDLAIAVGVLPEGLEKLDRLAELETFHRAFVRRHRKDLVEFLERVYGKPWAELRYRDSIPELLVRLEPRGDDEALPEGFRPLYGRTVYNLVDDVERVFAERLEALERGDD